MENSQELYPHIPLEMAQTLQEIAASPEQWQSSDAAAKSQVDATVARYRLEPGNTTIMVIGTSGAGKSATANTLLGKKVFKEGGSAVAMTTHFEVEKTNVDGIQLTVVDTPWAWNTQIHAKADMNLDDIFYIIAVNMASPHFGQAELNHLKSLKIHAKADMNLDDIFYIIAVNMASPRFDQAELNHLKSLKGHNRKSVLTPGRCLVVLTHADSALQQSSLQQYIDEIQGDPLHELLTEHNVGVIAINNSPTTEYEQSRHQQAMLNTVVAIKRQRTTPVEFFMLLYLLCAFIIAFPLRAALSILKGAIIPVTMRVVTLVTTPCRNFLGWLKEDTTIKKRV